MLENFEIKIVRMKSGEDIIAFVYEDYKNAGDFRFNTDTNLVEVYYASVWNSLSKIGQVNITKDTFTGDSATLSFTMTQMPANYAASPTDDNKVIVSVGNVLQNPTVQYQLDGNQITFTSEPPFGQTIVVLHGFASTNPL